MADDASIFGYTFRDRGLLATALTAPACRMSRPETADNQRLEFLGDAVLNLLAADRLYAEAPNVAEGALTVRRARLVSTATLCAAAARFGLAARLRLNHGAAPLDPHAKTLADAVEAVLGAVWLDGGLAAARAVFDALDLPAAVRESGVLDNPKGTLQERAQAMVPPRHPHYRRLAVAGTSDKPVFTVEVSVDGIGSAVAQGGSVRAAETAAAAKLLASSREQPIAR